MKYYVIKQTIEFLVRGESENLAMNYFCDHGPNCREIQHLRSQSMATGEYVEGDSDMDAFSKLLKARK